MIGKFGSGAIGVLDHLGNKKDFQRPFLILLTIYATLYFSELANFSLSIDDEFAAIRENAAIWVTQDRWVQYLVEQFIVSQPVLPFFPGFMFGCLISASYLLLIRAHGYRADEPSVLVVFGLFCAFPTLFFVLDFACITVGLGIGIFLACACVYSFGATMRARLERRLGRREWLGFFALQTGLATLATGAYQSLILLVAAGCCGLFILEYLRRPSVSAREFAVIHAYLACVLIASGLASFLIARGFQLLLAVEPQYIAKTFWKPGQLLANPLIVIKRALGQYADIYGGAKSVYGFARHVTFPAILVLGALSLVLRRPPAGPKRVLFVAAYLFGLSVIPFGINMANNGVLPYRALIAIPYVFWFFAAAAIFSQARTIRRLAVILVVIVIAQCLYTFSMFQATKRLVLDHDMQVASEVYRRIVDAVPGFDRSATYYVDFYGALEFNTVYPEIATSTMSASFFEWDGGSARRIAAFMRILGYSNIVELDRERRAAYLPVSQSLPIWPQRGSVTVVDGNVVLVRLGKDPGTLHRMIIDAK